MSLSFRAVAVAVTLLALAGCGSQATVQTTTETATATKAAPTVPHASCHYRKLPSGQVGADQACTPGALNPDAVKDPQHTICVHGYSAKVRPPVSVTGPWKLASMKQYGDTATPHVYEYDHLVAIEDGGAPADRANLWPEPGGSPNAKDSVENRLHIEICAGRMTVQQAAAVLEGDWAK